MNWRQAVAVCASVLLSLPLALLLWGLLRPEVQVGGTPGVRISPMLTNEQRMRLVTYRRYCGHDGVCEPPLGCFFDVRFVRSYCTDSQCLTDAQCQEGEVCRTLATWGGGPLVRLCVPVGPRQEGEPCIALPRDRTKSCAAEWVCGGREQGWCARPCHPAGQQCITFKEGASMCAQSYGPSCRQSPCPDGRKCDVERASSYPNKVWMECVEPCGEGQPACGAGKVCDGWHCLPACRLFRATPARPTLHASRPAAE